MKKLLGEERRAFLIDLLKTERAAITGTDLAKRSNVSRQVIVNDMALLKARNPLLPQVRATYILCSRMKK